MRTSWLELLVIAALVLSGSGCVSFFIEPTAQVVWEEAPIPMCAADSEGLTVHTDLRSSDDVWFEGRVVTRDENGELVPVTDAEFLSYSVGFRTKGAPEDWDPKTSYLWKAGIVTDGEGYFFDPSIVASFVELTVCRKGELEIQTIPESVIYLLRAPGCEDHRVVFDTKWVDHEIELNCDQPR